MRFKVRGPEEDTIEFWLEEGADSISLYYDDPEDGKLCILKVSNNGVEMQGWGAGTTFPKGEDCQVMVID